MTVLITGFVVGILGLQPVEVILVVQALNGLILPVVAIFLILMVNDPALVPAKFRHRPLYNVALLTVLSGILLISAHNIVKTFGAGFALNSPGLQFLLFSITALVVLWVTVRVVRMRRGTHE
jgi:Mn2+/Fe2+ NRAMP family transporter